MIFRKGSSIIPKRSITILPRKIAIVDYCPNEGSMMQVHWRGYPNKTFSTLKILWEKPPHIKRIK